MHYRLPSINQVRFDVSEGGNHNDNIVMPSDTNYMYYNKLMQNRRSNIKVRCVLHLKDI